jgi:hypothetical protein
MLRPTEVTTEASMNNRILRGVAASLLCVGLTATGAASAQDARTQSQTQDEYSSSSSSRSPNQSTSQSSVSKQTVMKNCVARERAGDSTMSESEATKACQDALRAERDNPDNEPRPHQQ